MSIVTFIRPPCVPACAITHHRTVARLFHRADEQTFGEIEHGARVAWRNASKCINRIVHQELTLLDCRDVTTNEAMVRSLESAAGRLTRIPP